LKEYECGSTTLSNKSMNTDFVVCVKTIPHTRTECVWYVQDKSNKRRKQMTDTLTIEKKRQIRALEQRRIQLQDEEQYLMDPSRQAQIDEEIYEIEDTIKKLLA